jgi:hypothetical protein
MTPSMAGLRRRPSAIRYLFRKRRERMNAAAVRA